MHGASHIDSCDPFRWQSSCRSSREGHPYKLLHKTLGSCGPEARWRRCGIETESIDSATNSLLALGLRCSASQAYLL